MAAPATFLWRSIVEPSYGRGWVNTLLSGCGATPAAALTAAFLAGLP